MAGTEKNIFPGQSRIINMSAENKKFFQELESQKRPVNTERVDSRLKSALPHILEIANEFTLDPFPTKFEVVPSNVMYEIASYGLLERYVHWTHGRDFWIMKTGYDRGRSKLYEVVTNSDPSWAYLLENNIPIENMFVMAHVLGHTDFFKHNYLFQKTRRDMNLAASLYAQRIDGYIYDKGIDRVEKVLDAALAIEEHVNPFKQYRPLKDEELVIWREEYEGRGKKNKVRKGEFDDLLEPDSSEPKVVYSADRIYPPTPDRDLLGIIRNHAPYLEDWERDIVDIVRNESHYFYPQRRTKIMNEGWAVYWHKRIMREMRARDYTTEAEDEKVWKIHSGVVQPAEKGINPYHFGSNMFEYFTDYHNGNLSYKEKRWLEKTDRPVYSKFNGDFIESPGLAKAKEIRQSDDDQSFIRNYFDKLISDRLEFYVYEEQKKGNNTITVIKEDGWEVIRDMLARSMSNNGHPYIVCTDIDYEKKQGLYLLHEYEGRELDSGYITKNLPYIHSLWRRPVTLETVAGNTKRSFSYDGKDFTIK